MGLYIRFRPPFAPSSLALDHGHLPRRRLPATFSDGEPRPSSAGAGHGRLPRARATAVFRGRGPRPSSAGAGHGRLPRARATAVFRGAGPGRLPWRPGRGARLSPPGLRRPPLSAGVKGALLGLRRGAERTRGLGGLPPTKSRRSGERLGRRGPAVPSPPQPPARGRGSTPENPPPQRIENSRGSKTAEDRYRAASNASYTFLGIRPRGGTSNPWDRAQARTAAGSGATDVRL